MPADPPPPTDPTRYADMWISEQWATCPEYRSGDPTPRSRRKATPTARRAA